MELGRIEISWNTNFTMVPNELWDIEDLSHEEFRVFMYLMKLKANKGGFPPYLEIAEKCQLRNNKGQYCESKTREVLKGLVKNGLIKNNFE